MKAEYDFSKGARGKFYNARAEFVYPIHLDADVSDRISHLAETDGIDLQTLVNEWLRAKLKGQAESD